MSECRVHIVSPHILFFIRHIPHLLPCLFFFIFLSAVYLCILSISGNHSVEVFVEIIWSAAGRIGRKYHCLLKSTFSIELNN